MTDTTTPPASGTPSTNGTSPKPGIDPNHLAEEGKKVAVKAWDWTKKAIAFAWPKVKQGAHVVSEKVDAEMDKIIESVNHPQHTASTSTTAGTPPAAPKTESKESEPQA
jgi:hypothetical protein